MGLMIDAGEAGEALKKKMEEAIEKDKYEEMMEAAASKAKTKMKKM